VLARATSAAGIAARRGLASGVSSLRRLETPTRDSSRMDALALLAFGLLEAFPFPCPESQRYGVVILANSDPDPTACPPTSQPASRAVLGSTSQALQERSRSGSYSLCYRVSKSREVGVTSSEVAGPLRFLSSSQPLPVECRTALSRADIRRLASAGLQASRRYSPRKRSLRPRSRAVQRPVLQAR
jgi:hypothetical protein